MKHKHEHDWLRERLLARAGVGEEDWGKAKEGLRSLALSEWSHEFERLMRNRLLMGRFRYGRLDRVEDTGYDRLGSAIKRIAHFQATGNKEFLVDAANLLMVEFMHTTHPQAHFHAIDDGEHTERG